jgi:steroid 5-alpha reductase family enzyme
VPTAGNRIVTGLQFVIMVAAVSVALALIMTAAWFIWSRTKNSGWVDTTWTFGLGAVGVAGALTPVAPSGLSSRQILVAVLIACWSLRLGLHIAHRTARITDDPRYGKLLRGWGANARRQMFFLLQKQAVVSVPLAISMLIAAWNPAPGLRFGDFIGAAVLVIGILGEGLADRQLRRFRADPANRGRVCDCGLWSWSRHPNYFFEWFGWLAYPLIAVGPAYPWGWLALLGPVSMYWLLVHVSGVPPLEEHMLEVRPETFRKYQARTSKFFPLPPRRIEQRQR